MRKESFSSNRPRPLYSLRPSHPTASTTDPRGATNTGSSGLRINPTARKPETVETTILGNDDAALFFEPITFAVEAVMTYEIVEPKAGTVWKWDGSNWIKPTGDDSVRIGVPSPLLFHENQTENLPTYVKRYWR